MLRDTIAWGYQYLDLIHRPTTYHGVSAHLLRNQAERMSKTRSVAMVPPLGCVKAATAGIIAMKTGLECHHVESSDAANMDVSLFRLTRCRLSVEERKDCCASERLERSELRRRGRFGEGGRTPSANVDARFSILWRKRDGIWEPVAWPSGVAPSIVGGQKKQWSTAACSRQRGRDGVAKKAPRVAQMVAVVGAFWWLQ